MPVREYEFGVTKSGQSVTAFSIKNDNNITVDVMDYGATVLKFVVPDKNGKLDDIVLGFDNFSPYESDDNPYFGASIGRFANRISKGEFELNGTQYNLTVNNNGNHLHGGGAQALSKKIWGSQIKNGQSISFFVESTDGEEGFPGHLKVSIDFILNNKNELIIKYKSSTDKDTVINFTNHSYWNLNGSGGHDFIYDHDLRIMANDYLDQDDNNIPTGVVKTVHNTDMDFRSKKKIGEGINKVVDSGEVTGYNHNYVLDKKTNVLEEVAELSHVTTGRALSVLTTEPGLQLYSSNYFDRIYGKDKNIYRAHSAICLETQHFPDSPNHPHFPTTTLKKDELFESSTIYKFRVLN